MEAAWKMKAEETFHVTKPSHDIVNLGSLERY